MVKKRIQNAVLGCSLKNDRMISVHLQGKPFNIAVIQVYAPTSNTEETEVERFYEDLRDLFELTPKKDILFILGDWNAKVGSQETPGVTGSASLRDSNKDFPGGPVVKDLPANAGMIGLIPGLGRFHMPWGN